MILLNLEQLLRLHSLAIENTGGSAGVRDIGRLEAAIATQTQNVFGEELYPGVVPKTAALMRGLVADHAVVDGNKRTAMLAGLTLLELNGVSFYAQPGEIEDFAVRIATKHLDVTEIAAWLYDHTA